MNNKTIQVHLTVLEATALCDAGLFMLSQLGGMKNEKDLVEARIKLFMAMKSVMGVYKESPDVG